MDYLEEKNIVYRVFNEVQGNSAKHEQYAQIFSELYFKKQEEFIGDFSNCVYTLLVQKGMKKEVDIRCKGNESLGPYCPIFLEEFISYTKAKEKDVRLRCVLLMNEIMVQSKVMDLDEELWKKLKQVYIERSRDKVIAIRSAAAYGLCCLQNAPYPDEGLLSVICHNIHYEPNESIRIIYARSIIIHPMTMETIVECVNDEGLSVRRSILENLRDHSVIQQLSIALRHRCVRCLRDRNDVIVKEAEALIIENWAKKESLTTLLSLLVLEEEEDICELFLNAVFMYEHTHHSKAFTGSVLPSINNLSPITSFYLYSMIRFLFEQSREPEIDGLIPDIPLFCNMIRMMASNREINKVAQCYVYRNAIRCLQYLEITDEICRNEMIHLIHDLFNLNSYGFLPLLLYNDDVYILLQAMLNLVETESALLSEVSLLCSDVEDRIGENKSQESASSQDSLINELCVLLLRVIQATYKLLSSSSVQSPEAQYFFEHIVVNYLQSPVCELRLEAVKCLILIGIMNERVARQYVSLLVCMVLEEEEEEEVQKVAINGLTDFIIVYGDIKRLSEETDEIMSTSEIVDGFCTYIFSEKEGLQLTVVQCLCRLYMYDRIRSIHQMSNLLILFFDNGTITKTLLRQTLAVFLPSFCNPHQDKNCAFLMESAIHMIKGVAETSLSGHYSMITQLGRFLLSLMTMDIKKSEKRGNSDSDDEAPNEEEKPDYLYHSTIQIFLTKLLAITSGRIDDSAFVKETINVLAFVQPEYLTKAGRQALNKWLTDTYSAELNVTLKRQIKAKNKSICLLDPSLEKLK